MKDALKLVALLILAEALWFVPVFLILVARN